MFTARKLARWAVSISVAVALTFGVILLFGASTTSAALFAAISTLTFTAFAILFATFTLADIFTALTATFTALAAFTATFTLTTLAALTASTFFAVFFTIFAAIAAIFAALAAQDEGAESPWLTLFIIALPLGVGVGLGGFVLTGSVWWLIIAFPADWVLTWWLGSRTEASANAASAEA